MTAFDDGNMTSARDQHRRIRPRYPERQHIIMHRADMFGLAQLYQLRGRVGRAKLLRGYAYLTYAPARAFEHRAAAARGDADARPAGRRLFSLASHDMDIRGAGNLLGEEQSGHIREVGIELYQQMLEEAVARRCGLGGGSVADDPSINGRRRSISACRC
jgi:transcription-repair coupling factor (superfamily II helicase)